MGTSSSHSGNKDNKGLLPSDYNGQQSKLLRKQSELV